MFVLATVLGLTKGTGRRAYSLRLDGALEGTERGDPIERHGVPILDNVDVLVSGDRVLVAVTDPARIAVIVGRLA